MIHADTSVARGYLLPWIISCMLISSLLNSTKFHVDILVLRLKNNVNINDTCWYMSISGFHQYIITLIQKFNMLCVSFRKCFVQSLLLHRRAAEEIAQFVAPLCLFIVPKPVAFVNVVAWAASPVHAERRIQYNASIWGFFCCHFTAIGTWQVDSGLFMTQNWDSFFAPRMRDGQTMKRLNSGV